MSISREPLYIPSRTNNPSTFPSSSPVCGTMTTPMLTSSQPSVQPQAIVNVSTPTPTPVTYAPIHTKSSIGCSLTLIISILLCIIFIVIAGYGIYLPLCTQAITGGVTCICMLIWRYATHRTADTIAMDGHEINQGTSTSTLISHFGGGMLMGLLFTALIAGEQLFLIMVIFANMYVDSIIGCMIYVILLILVAFQFWIIIYALRIRVSASNITSRTFIMNTVSYVTGMITFALYCGFTLLSILIHVLSSINLGDEPRKNTGITAEAITFALLTAFLAAATIIPMDMIGGEYMSIRLALQTLAPLRYGARKWYHAIGLPILMRICLSLLALGMFALTIYQTTWSISAIVYLIASWCTLILPFAYHVRSLRYKWSDEITSLHPIQFSHVHVQPVQLI